MNEGLASQCRKAIPQWGELGDRERIPKGDWPGYMARSLQGGHCSYARGSSAEWSDAQITEAGERMGKETRGDPLSDFIFWPHQEACGFLLP